jgi:hypothetical protein
MPPGSSKNLLADFFFDYFFAKKVEVYCKGVFAFYKNLWYLNKLKIPDDLSGIFSFPLARRTIIGYIPFLVCSL